MGWVINAPTALRPGKTRYPLYRRMGGTQGRSRWERKISPPPEFDPQIVRPVASRYTDWAIPANSHFLKSETIISLSQEVKKLRIHMLIFQENVKWKYLNLMVFNLRVIFCAI
jgi:hypothetical protein